MDRRAFITTLLQSVPAVDLISGLIDKVKTRIGYRVRKPKAYWGVAGTFTPSREYILNHLRHSNNHKHAAFQKWPLEEFTYDELQSLHSDHHENRVMANISRNMS